MKGDQQGAPPWADDLYRSLKNQHRNQHLLPRYFHPASFSAVYSCALLRDILLQGRLYISRNWLCFYANLFGKDIKVSGPTDWLPCSWPLIPSKINGYFCFVMFSLYRSKPVTWCWIRNTQSEWTNQQLWGVKLHSGCGWCRRIYSLFVDIRGLFKF